MRPYVFKFDPSTKKEVPYYNVWHKLCSDILFPSNRINWHWDRGRFSFDLANFAASERPIFMSDKKSSSDLWFLTLSRFLANQRKSQNSKFLKISKPLLDQSFGEKSDLDPKTVIFRLKWKLSPFNYPEFFKNFIFLFPFKFNFCRPERTTLKNPVFDQKSQFRDKNSQNYTFQWLLIWQVSLLES